LQFLGSWGKDEAEGSDGEKERKRGATADNEQAGLCLKRGYVILQ